MKNNYTKNIDHFLSLFYFLFIVSFILSCASDPSEPENTVTDVDGNTYKTVQIGDQCWMADNLKTTHFPDGSPILLGHDTLNLYHKDSLQYYFNYQDDSFYHEEYGPLYEKLISTTKLYTWAAATNSQSNGSLDGIVQGVCPDGWHLPNKNDWDELINFVGDSIAGQSLKSTNRNYWKFEGEQFLGTDLFGFNSIATGGRGAFGSHNVVNITSQMWSSSTQVEEWRVWTPYIVHWNNEIQWLGYAKSSAFCIRCIQNK